MEVTGAYDVSAEELYDSLTLPELRDATQEVTLHDQRDCNRI
jgi:hypothetical protein